MAEDRVYEVHGTLRFMQCQGRKCQSAIWPTDDAEISGMTVDEETARVSSDVPKCPSCKGTARPNVLMFGDWNYRHDRENVQSEHYRQWRALVEKEAGNLVVLEIGAGKAVPTVRHESRTVNRWTGAPVIRINPEEPQADHLSDCVSIVSIHRRLSLAPAMPVYCPLALEVPIPSLVYVCIHQTVVWLSLVQFHSQRFPVCVRVLLADLCGALGLLGSSV